MKITLIVLGVVLQLALSTGVPHRRDRRQFTGPRKVEEESVKTCQNFTVEECNNLGVGYNTALFPNHKGWNLKQARARFVDFVPLVTSGCSAKVRTLFCFYFFPFCDSTMWNTIPTSARNDFKPIMPCRETCQDVRNGCEVLLESYSVNGHNFSWPDWLDCDDDYFLPARTSRCANGTTPVSKTDTKEIEPPTVEPTIEEVTEEDSSGAAATETLNGKPPPKTPTSAPPTPACSCTPKCNPRTRVTGKTFKNNNYTFVANVTVISEESFDNTRVFTVYVNQAYPLKSALQGRMTEAPEMAPVVILRTNPLCCPTCIQLIVSKTYIVAGYYREHPSLQWHMPADNSLAALNGDNASKYIKKLGNWIANANTHREEELEKETSS